MGSGIGDESRHVGLKPRLVIPSPLRDFGRDRAELGEGIDESASTEGVIAEPVGQVVVDREQLGPRCLRSRDAVGDSRVPHRMAAVEHFEHDRCLRGEDPVEALQRDPGRASQLVHTHRLDAPPVVQTVGGVEHSLSHLFIDHASSLLALRTFVLYSEANENDRSPAMKGTCHVDNHRGY